MKFVSALVIFFGLWSFAGVFYAPIGQALIALALGGWPAEPLTAAGLALAAISGGVMVGWGATLFRLCTTPEVSDASLAAIVRTGTWAWFVVDGAASVAAGASPNLVPNTVLLILALWATRTLR